MGHTYPKLQFQSLLDTAYLNALIRFVSRA